MRLGWTDRRNDAEHPREVHQKMLNVELVAVQPSSESCVGNASNVPMDEFRLRVRVLPLRCYVDQHTIEFLIQFFTGAGAGGRAGGKQAAGEEGSAQAQAQAQAQQAPGMFFQLCDVRGCDGAGVKVKLDYKPKNLDVREIQRGNYAELINLFPLQGVELKLQSVQLRGVTGWGAVVEGVLRLWVADVTNKQLHKFVTGSPPIRSVVKMGSGVADLVLVPLRQYRKDGNLLRGIRKGTIRCLKGLTVETLNASYRVTRVIANTLDELLCADTSAPAGGRAQRRLTQPDYQPKVGVLGRGASLLVDVVD
jgi:autophagy-related protein 2